MIYLIYFVWCELLHYNIEQNERINEKKNENKRRNDTKHKSKFPLQANKKDEP